MPNCFLRLNYLHSYQQCTRVSSTTHSLYPLPSASTSAGCDFLPGWVNQAFIPEGSAPLAVLIVWGCCMQRSIYADKKVMLPCPWWELSNVINLPLGSWVISPANGTTLGAQSWFLLLANWALSSGYSQAGLGNGNPFCWPSVYLSPLPPWLLCLWAHWWKQECLGKETDGIHKMCHPVYVNFKILFCWGHPLVNIHMEDKHLHIFSLIQRGLATFLFLKPTHHQFFNHVFSKSLIIQPNNWPQSMNI